MEEKLKELTAKYELPDELLKDAIELEKEKLILKNRKLAPILAQLIERHASEGPNGPGEAHES
jgi:hypothetical protein